jgi:hypothetical protein
MARTMTRIFSALFGERVVAERGDGVVFLVVFLVVFPAVPTAASPLAVRARRMDETTRGRDDETGRCHRGGGG